MLGKQLKFDRPLIGWVLYDFANSAFATTVLAVIFPVYFAEVLAGGQEGTLLQMPWGAWQIQGSALWAFLVAVSTGLVAVTSPLLGAMADRASIRKRMLTVYCYVGVIATLSLAWVGADNLFWGGLIFIVANFGFAGGNVFYNAFLLDVSNRNTLGKISGLAWGAGYLGGGLCLVLNLIMLQKPQLLGFEPGTFTVGDCLIVSGLWWGFFALPTILWLREKQAINNVGVSIFKLTSDGWNRLKSTFNEVKHYRQLCKFLVSYLVFNDGVETIIIMAAIFGAEVVGMSTGELVGFFIIVQGAALIGSLFFGWLSDLIGNKNTLLITLVVWLGVVIWAYNLGWLIGVREDYYLLGIIVGLVLGGNQSAARALLASFTPRGRSGEFFGFFAISGRFASIFGPLVWFTAIVIGGGVRQGILFIGVFFLIGLALLLFVDEREGKAVAITAES